MQASGDNIEIVTGNSKGKFELFDHTTNNITYENDLNTLLKDIYMRLELVNL